MRLPLVLSFAVVLLAACETTSPGPSTQLEEPRERCDQVLTGSRIPQCNRGDVKSISRDELERTSPLTGNPNLGNPDSPGRPH